MVANRDSSSLHRSSHWGTGCPAARVQHTGEGGYLSRRGGPNPQPPSREEGGAVVAHSHAPSLIEQDEGGKATAHNGSHPFLAGRGRGLGPTAVTPPPHAPRSRRW